MQKNKTNNKKTTLIGNALKVLNQRETIEHQLNFLFKPDDVFEVCLIAPKTIKNRLWKNEWAGGKKAIVAGWYNNIQTAIDDILEADETAEPMGIYCTLNPVIPALLGRANNRLMSNPNRTQDKEISEVRHLLIDADPIRPTGISSTDQEKEQALELLKKIRPDLTAKGWDEPLFGDSGNGGHLIYRIDHDWAALVPDMLKALDEGYSTEQVNIDTTVGNPARITKVYGTKTRKGDSTNDRKHRYARILSLPNQQVSK